ncbi:FAD-binding domain-containing protein [Pholiota molesta]|nr:FAD-binding domain-containing protein [Pholiota molesta]
MTPDWDALNATVSGRLYRGVPYAKACFSTFNGESMTVDDEACSVMQKEYFDVHLPRSYQFGGFACTQFEMCMATGDNCHLDWLNPSNPAAFAPSQECKQGSVAPFYIDVRDKDDVLAAYEFSKKENVTLTIKNTGHDFKGRSSGPDTLSLWIDHETNFVAEGCNVEGQPALTFGAGTQFHDIQQFTVEHDLQFVGGSDQSVGAAGGWAQGGGHSPLSPNYGMGADRTLQYKIVTPDGVYRTVNACQNEDLFFALRGGGGGTFGVVLEATMMVSPKEPYRLANINWPVDNENLRSILGIFLDNVTSFAENGWGGYLTVRNLVLITPAKRVDAKSAVESMQALVDLSTSLGGVSTVIDIPTYDTWFQGWVDGNLGSQDPVGLPIVLTSRLIPAKNHETVESRTELLDALMSAFANSAFNQLHITTPYGFNGTDGSDTSVNPVWRQVLYQVMLVNGWFWDSTLADREQAFEASTKAVNFLREITPDSGAYVNESDVREPNWQDAFWGKHYPRLLAIKQKYDPDHLLDCWHCVGWKGATDPQYKCYI